MQTLSPIGFTPKGSTTYMYQNNGRFWDQKLAFIIGLQEGGNIILYNFWFWNYVKSRHIFSVGLTTWKIKV
jgi:hypothetical protein